MRSKNLYPITILLLVALLSALGATAFLQGQGTPAASDAQTPPVRTLTVSGSGKAYLTPDIAYVNIGVHTQGKDATQAVASNNTQSQKVVDALRQLGIAAKDIQTTNFSIYPQQQYDSQGQPTGEITYMVDNSVFVTVHDLDKIGQLLDAAVKAGANSINGVQFDVADRAQALSDARKEAVADAQAQAQELAQAAGLKLGQVQSINVYGGSPPPMPVYQTAKGAGGMAEAAASIPVSPGQLIVTVDVNVVYQIQ